MKSFEERSPRWQRNANRLDVIADAVMALSVLTTILAGLLVLGFFAAVAIGIWKLLSGL